MGAMGAMGMMPPGMMPMPGYGVGMKRGRESEGPYIPNKMQHRPRSMGGAATGDAMEVGTFFQFFIPPLPHPYLRLSFFRSGNGAPSRKGCVINDRVGQATNE